MLSADRIALKRLKRRRIIANRLKSYGSVFSHNTMKFRERRSILSRLKNVVMPTILPTANKREQKTPFLKRIFNRFRNNTV